MSESHHEAFINVVTYAIFHFTGRFGGPNIRQHVGDNVVNESGIEWMQRPREELYVLLEPVIYGPIQDMHITTWIMLEDICFNNDPMDVQLLIEHATTFTIKHEGRYESTHIWPQYLRKIRIIAATCDESVVEMIDRLANQEFARLHYTKQNNQ